MAFNVHVHLPRHEWHLRFLISSSMMSSVPTCVRFVAMRRRTSEEEPYARCNQFESLLFRSLVICFLVHVQSAYEYAGERESMPSAAVVDEAMDASGKKLR